MLACIFATNRNCTAADRPLRWTLQGHLQGQQNYENPHERQGGDGLIRSS